MTTNQRRGSQDAVRPNQPVDVGVVRPEGGRVEDDVAAIGGQRPVGAVDEPCVAQHVAALQRERTELEGGPVTHEAGAAGVRLARRVTSAA